jgi:Pyruvate/2-oxoacid:ferredoxin oxidoreductase delta subunit
MIFGNCRASLRSSISVNAVTPYLIIFDGKKNKMIKEPTYKKLIVYYFSGTGNSQKVAFWLLQVAKEMNLETELLNIAHLDRSNVAAPTQDTLVVFTSPVHGFNYPPIMLHFISRFPKGKNNVLLMDTRAGMLIGKWITPGMSGITFYLSGLLLTLKGYKIKAMYPVDLPSNWISLHPGLNARTVAYIYKQNKERVITFVRKALAGGRNFKSVRSIVSDMLVLPIAFGYFLIGRFLLAKTFYASRDCNDCDVCIKNCPVKAIIKVDARLFWTFRCESCMRCMSNCPQKAIETSHGSTVGFSILFYSVLWISLSCFLNNYAPVLCNGMIGFIVQTVLFLGLLAVWYWASHYLMRFKWFERIEVYTSLTWYKFWGRRYKAPQEKNE